MKRSKAIAVVLSIAGIALLVVPLVRMAVGNSQNGAAMPVTSSSDAVQGSVVAWMPHPHGQKINVTKQHQSKASMDLNEAKPADRAASLNPSPLQEARVNAPRRDDLPQDISRLRDQALTHPDDERRAAAITQLGHESLDVLDLAAQDPSARVRAARLQRYRELDEQAGDDDPAGTPPGSRAKFENRSLDSLSYETDERVISEGLEYLSEHGDNSPEERDALLGLTSRLGLSPDALSLAAELLVEEHHLDRNAVIAMIMASPSARAMNEEDMAILGRNLDQMTDPSGEENSTTSD